MNAYEQMREALESMISYYQTTCRCCMSISPVLHQLAQNARYALSTPPLNCNRFATAEEARLEFQRIRGHKVWADIELWDDMDEVFAFVRWLFAQEGKEA